MVLPQGDFQQSLPFELLRASNDLVIWGFRVSHFLPALLDDPMSHADLKYELSGDRVLVNPPLAPEVKEEE